MTTGPALSPPPLPISTKRLVLRSARPDDARWLRYYTDPEVCRYLLSGPHDEAALLERNETMRKCVAPSGPGEVLALMVEHDGDVIGDLMLRLGAADARSGLPATAEVGWVFAREHGGRGFATEAAAALVDLAFEHYGVHRVVARLNADNLSSSRLCERLGMVREAHLRRDVQTADGAWSDVLVYGLLRDGWAAATRR